MIRYIIFVSLLTLFQLTGFSNSISKSETRTPPFAMCDCTVSQGGIIYDFPFFSTSESASEFYAYGAPIGASSNTGLETSNGMIMLLHEDLLTNETSLVIVLDAPSDGSGGDVEITFNCLPLTAFVDVADDPGEFTGNAPNIVGDFFWASCCTDGGVIGGIGCGNTFTINPDIGSGIDEFTLVSGTPEFPEYINLAEIDCPITINCGGPVCCEESFEFDANIENATCSQGLDGSIDLTTTCSEDPIFEWSNGNTTEDLINVFPGEYTVTVTDAGGCVLIESYTINYNEVILEVDGETNNIDCFDDMNGSITNAVGNSMNIPFSYEWSNGEVTQDLVDLDAGIYTLTVTDNFGCTGTQEFLISEPNELDGIIINIIQPVSPSTNGSSEVIVLGGTPSYTYSWDNGETTPTANELAPGIHNVTVVDSRGCELILTVEIYEPLSAIFNVTENFCFSECEGSIEIQAIGGLAPYTYTWIHGEITSTIVDLCADIYTCIITDDYGSFYQVEINVESYPEIFLDTDFSNTICYLSNDGYIDLSVSGGLFPYTFNWSNGAMTEDITQLSNGLYQVTITDSNNCAIEETFFIEEAPVLTFDTIINPADCSLNNGSIFLVDFEGENPYLYSWSSGETTDSITNKSTGNYSVTITDNIGCIQVYELVIPNTQSATLNSTVENVTCENGSDGSIDINIINGNPPYIYTWNTGDSANFIDNLPSGFYAVTVTDDINCIYTASFNLVVTSLIDADTTIIDESCIGVQDGAIEYNILNGFSPFQYTWSNGESESSIDNLSPGSYLLDVVDSLGCIYQNEFNILPGNTIILVDSVTHNICSGENNGSIEVVVSGQGPYTFLWDNNSTDSLINNLTSGLYSLSVTDIDGCFKIKEFQIDDPDPITNNIEIIQPGCDENILGTATAIPSGGTGDFNFLWSNGQNTSTSVELVPGSYTVTISDDNNCSFIDSIIVEEIIPLLVGASVDSIDCYGDFASIEINTITGVSPFKYLWNNGSNEQIRNDLLAGIHAVTVTDAYGCSEELSFNLSQPNILSNSVVESISPTSNGLDGFIQINIFGGTKPYSIEWSNGLTDVLTIDNLDYGIYTYTIIDSNGCITFGEIVFTPEPLIYTLDLINNLCFGQCIGSIGLEISGGATPYSFLWSTGSQDNLSEQLCNGIYSVTVEDNLGSSIIIDELIIDSPPILNSLNVVSDETCIDFNDGTISLNAFGGEPPYNYFLNGLTVSSTVTNLEPGNYAYLVVDNFGCEYTNTVNINAVDPITLDVTQQNINCDNPNGQIEIVSNNINGYEVLLNGDSYGSDNTISINNLSAADYTIQYIINDDCIEDVENITILDEGLFEINFNPEVIKINLGEDFNINIVISDPGNIIQSIDWFSNSNIQCDQFNEESFCTVLSGTSNQDDFITLITTLNNGCIYEYFIPIEVEIVTDLTIPNIFSPNGDGTNDVFTIQANPSILEINSFSIYDRWGNKLFDEDNVNPINFEGWDGKFNNITVQPGVYIYSILVTFINGQTKHLIGDITIVT